MDTINNNNQSSLVIKRQVQVDSISKAIYLITDLFDNTEPLKLSLRKTVVTCLEDQNNYINFIKLNSLINLASSVGLISNMNSELLIKVINNHLDNIVVKADEKTNDLDITNIFKSNEVSVEKSEDTGEVNINTDKKPDILKIEAVKHISDSVTDSDKKVANITINNNTQNIKNINNISMDIGSRRKKILEIVKARGAVTINEFIESIKGVSSKTIQRELTSLVLSGTLKKTGERRWSKYSLK